jgi:hypothetical protein
MGVADTPLTSAAAQSSIGNDLASATKSKTQELVTTPARCWSCTIAGMECLATRLLPLQIEVLKADEHQHTKENGNGRIQKPHVVRSFFDTIRVPHYLWME